MIMKTIAKEVEELRELATTELADYRVKLDAGDYNQLVGKQKVALQALDVIDKLSDELRAAMKELAIRDEQLKKCFKVFKDNYIDVSQIKSIVKANNAAKASSDERCQTATLRVTIEAQHTYCCEEDATYVKEKLPFLISRLQAKEYGDYEWIDSPSLYLLNLEQFEALAEWPHGIAVSGKDKVVHITLKAIK